MGTSGGGYRVLVGRSERSKPLGRLRRRWENNIKINLREVGLIWLRIGTGSGLL
jgi:hypothetical protein